MTKNNFWSPYIAGTGLGLTLLATFSIAGWGLGASSTFSLLASVGMNQVFPDFTRGLTYFSQYLNAEAPLKNWMLFEIIGVFLGGLRQEHCSPETSESVLSGVRQLALGRDSLPP